VKASSWKTILKEHAVPQRKDIFIPRCLWCDGIEWSKYTGLQFEWVTTMIMSVEFGHMVEGVDGVWFWKLFVPRSVDVATFC
jgi:hypothetical protein